MVKVSALGVAWKLAKELLIVVSMPLMLFLIAVFSGVSPAFGVAACFTSFMTSSSLKSLVSNSCLDFSYIVNSSVRVFKLATLPSFRKAVKAASRVGFKVPRAWRVFVLAALSPSLGASWLSRSANSLLLFN